MSDRRRWLAWALTTIIAAVPFTSSAAERWDEAAARKFLRLHCLDCHGPDAAEGGVRFDALAFDKAGDGPRWAVIRDQLRKGLMPPPGEPRPDQRHVQAMLDWIDRQAADRPERLPGHGNLAPHATLFHEKAPPGRGATPARLWRLSPERYAGFIQDLGFFPKHNLVVVAPFSLIPDRGVKDYASLYAMDEPTTDILVRNASAIVERQWAHRLLEDGTPRALPDTVALFVKLKLMSKTEAPSPQQLEEAVRTQFRLVLAREATADEVKRFTSLYASCAANGDRNDAIKTMLMAVLLRSDAVFRAEIGEAAGGERRRLTQREIALAVGQTLTHRREASLLAAAAKGDLATDEQVAAHVRRVLDDPKIEKPALLGFFREYFGYAAAPEVFKDVPKDLWFVPDQYVADTDLLVQSVLAEDRDVLRELLTTPRSFVNFAWSKNETTGAMDRPRRSRVPHPINQKGRQSIEAAYGVDDWTDKQPMTMPEGTRLGILMQPSWLVAWSTNFENDPVRRGRFIRERLLGGVVPDLPIGVVAQVPDVPDRSLRDRLTVTRDAKCWKCHQYMDDLGLPFENFDHFGRFRRVEEVVDGKATDAHVDKNGVSLGKVHRSVPLDTTGRVVDSGDPALDGPVSDPRELVLRLADSDRVRQVFLRHAFRYYLGRNESSSDAAALQAADRAYVSSGGSFRTLLASLLTSESFLYRTQPKNEEAERTPGPGVRR